MRPAFAASVGLLILAVLVSIVVPQATYVAACLGLVALALGLPTVQPRQRLIGAILVGVGLVALSAALALGARPAPIALLTLNQDIVGMLGAVAFLGFIRHTVGDVRPRLAGRLAVSRTVLVTHLLSAVINLSAVTIVADHLRRDGKIHRGEATLITRAFAASAFWSPFWAGTAAALVFVPSANIGLVILVGAPLAAIALALTMSTVFRSLGDELPGYRGYPLSWPLLRIPLALLVSVLALHLAFPAVPIPRYVALTAVIALLVYSLASGPATAHRTLAREARTVLPGLGGEVVLFISAGIMAVGLSTLLKTVRFELPLDGYTVWVAWAGAVVIILLALVGVHQVISIGLIGSLVLPLEPEPTLFLLSMIIGHGISAGVGPLTALQMHLHGRYGVDTLDTTRRNLPFLAVSLVLSLPALFLVERLAAVAAGAAGAGGG